MKATILIIADRRGQRQVAVERGIGLAEKLGYQVLVAGFVYESLEGASKPISFCTTPGSGGRACKSCDIFSLRT